MSDQKILVATWPVGTDLFWGRLVFSTDSLSAARKTPTSVVAALKEELERGGESIPREVENPQLKRIFVEVRPNLVRQQGKKRERLGAGDGVLLPIDIVFGELSPEVSLCEILQFNQMFYMRGNDKLQSLVEHFVRDAAAQASPEALFRMMLQPAPSLQESNFKNRESTQRVRRETPRLSAITERIVGLPPGWPGIWERQSEVTALEAALQRQGSILLVGAPRVGRSSILLEAARKLRKKVKIYRTQAQRLTAGAKYLGEWQELCEQLIAELTSEDGILWIEDLVRIFRIGGRGVEDSVGAYLRPALGEGLRLIGEVTPQEYQALQRLVPGFLDHFEIFRIEPLASQALTEVVGHISESYKNNRQIQIDAGAQRLAIRLLDRFVRQEHFPGKIVTFLNDCVREQEAQKQNTVDSNTVITQFTRRTGMPAQLIDDRIPLDPNTLRQWLGQRISGQPTAIEEAVRVLTTFKAGLNDSARPVSTLLFAGPTGVGKTATARAIAAWCFGSDRALIRVDMSECQHPAQLARLIGSPGGEPGELIRRVRENPFGVVLLDEVEKAHPAFFDTLLTVLDEGTMTDAFGRVTDFRGTLVILTSNLGARQGSSLGFADTTQTLDMGAIKKFFRPEFLNRIDKVVPFLPLTRAAIRTIAETELASIAHRPGFASRNLQLLFSDTILDRVVATGFDPLLGARPLQRTIEQTLVARIAAWLLDHPCENTILTIDEQNGEIHIG